MSHRFSSAALCTVSISLAGAMLLLSSSLCTANPNSESIKAAQAVLDPSEVSSEITVYLDQKPVKFGTWAKGQSGVVVTLSTEKSERLQAFDRTIDRSGTNSADHRKEVDRMLKTHGTSIKKLKKEIAAQIKKAAQRGKRASLKRLLKKGGNKPLLTFETQGGSFANFMAAELNKDAVSLKQKASKILQKIRAYLLEAVQKMKQSVSAAREVVVAEGQLLKAHGETAAWQAMAKVAENLSVAQDSFNRAQNHIKDQKQSKGELLKGHIEKAVNHINGAIQVASGMEQHLSRNAKEALLNLQKQIGSVLEGIEEKLNTAAKSAKQRGQEMIGKLKTKVHALRAKLSRHDARSPNEDAVQDPYLKQQIPPPSYQETTRDSYLKQQIPPPKSSRSVPLSLSSDEELGESEA
jgi:arsenate reductase-like glutaredoxin family protein